MDIHVNELAIEKGFDNVKLNQTSFRDIDQEFIIVHSDKSYCSELINELYYCFIKPYEGLKFRLIGVSNQDDNILVVDEDNSKVKDIDYESIKDEVISKIVENGDLISNQLIVDIPFDYYGNNDDYADLMKTRNVEWIDDRRIKGNPDCLMIRIGNDDLTMRLITMHSEGLVAETEKGEKYLIKENGIVSPFEIWENR